MEDAHQAIVQGGREPLEVEPNVERALWRNLNIEMKLLKTRQDVVALSLKVFLERDLRNEILSGSVKGEHCINRC